MLVVLAISRGSNIITMKSVIYPTKNHQFLILNAKNLTCYLKITKKYLCLKSSFEAFLRKSKNPARFEQDFLYDIFQVQDYFPGNAALRFSKNAVVPSLKSSVPKQFPNSVISVS